MKRQIWIATAWTLMATIGTLSAGMAEAVEWTPQDITDTNCDGSTNVLDALNVLGVALGLTAPDNCRDQDGNGYGDVDFEAGYQQCMHSVSVIIDANNDGLDDVSYSSGLSAGASQCDDVIDIEFPSPSPYSSGR